MAKKALDEAGLPYTVMDVAEHRELARQYGILQAPTLVIRRDGQVEKLVGAAAVTAYAQNHN